MSILQSIILGLIQGVTEFLPISSSGHLAIIPYFFDWPEQTITFDVTLHLGTLLALVISFRKELMYLVKTTVTVIRKISQDPENLLQLEKFNGDRLPLLIIISTIPIGIAGLIFGERVSEISKSPFVVSGALIFFGLVMWFVDRRYKVAKKLSNIDFYDSLMIGGAQVLSLIRGTSRSAVTITMGRFLGFSRSEAAKFSFLLSVPTIAVASVFSLIQLVSAPRSFEILPALIGFITSFTTGFFAIKILLKLIDRFGLAPFVIYRITLGAVIIILALK